MLLLGVEENIYFEIHISLFLVQYLIGTNSLLLSSSLYYISV